MQRRVNVFVPFACPRCDAEMVVTLDELHDGATVRCATCGTKVPLKPEEPSLPQRPAQANEAPLRFQV